MEPEPLPVPGASPQEATNRPKRDQHHQPGQNGQDPIAVDVLRNPGGDKRQQKEAGQGQ